MAAPPDLLICDLMMPEVDGFEVVGQLKETAATAAIPILILTAHDLTAADKVRLNGRVLGIATKGASGAEGLSDWLSRVLPLAPPTARIADVVAGVAIAATVGADLSV
jgi:CheY-like chemotaxis protein